MFAKLTFRTDIMMRFDSQRQAPDGTCISILVAKSRVISATKRDNTPSLHPPPRVILVAK